MDNTNLMLDAIKKKYKEGDKIVLVTNSKRCRCKILSFLPSSLLVEVLSSGAIIKVSDKSIEGVMPFMQGKPKAQKPAAPVQKTKPAVSPQDKQSSQVKVSAPVKPPAENKTPSEVKSNQKPDINTKAQLPTMGYISKVEDTEIEITDNEGHTFSVARDRVIDKVVIKAINQMTGAIINIPVIWCSVDGEVICVLGQSSAEQLNSRVNTFRDSGNYKAALSIALLLDSHFKVERYHKVLESIKELYYGIKNEMDPQMSPYDAGVNKMKKGLYSDAIELFQEALKKNTKTSDCIRLIVNCYTFNDQYPEAIKYIKDMNLKEFPEGFNRNSKNFNWLLNFYFQQGLYNDCLDLISCKLKFGEVTSKTKSNLHTTAALCYLKLDDANSAVSHLEQAMRLDPDNVDAKNTLSDITGISQSTSDEIDNLRISSYSETYISRQDKFIQMDMAPSEDYVMRLNKDLNSLGAKAYEYRAKILLQIAKIEQIINPNKQDRSNKYRRYQSDHYIAQALYGFKNQILSEDSVRFHICESIALRVHDNSTISKEKVKDNIALYLNLFNENKQYIFVNTRIRTILASDLFNRPDFYKTVSYLMQYKLPFLILVRSFHESNYMISAVNFLKSRGYDISLNATKDVFFDTWKDYISRNRTKIESLNRQFSLMRNSSFDDTYRRYEEFKNSIEQYDDILSDLDKKRLPNLDVVMEILRQYFQSDDPGTKELRFKESKVEIERLIKEYTAEPTRFSYDCLVLLLEHLESSVSRDFKELIRISTPRAHLELIGDCIIDELTNTVSFQVKISNEAGCFPIRNFMIDIMLSDEVVQQSSPSERNYNSIYGGHGQIIQKQVELAKGVIAKGAVQVDMHLTYQTHGMEDYCELHESVSLQFKKQSEEIPNLYKACSEGSVPERDMFVGRDEYIASTATSLINSVTPKQIIIYGQRRSGKTSILRYLKKELISRGAFCVEFSLESLGAETGISGNSDIFFAYIMRRIALAIRRSGSDRPVFKYSEDEYYSNPNRLYEEYRSSFEITEKFIDDIAELHESFNEKEGWKDKKVVLLIDEFTRLYTMIEKGEMTENIMRQWKAVTQDERVHISVVMIGQDTTPAFKSKPYASNPFGVITDERISYLPEDGARKLIVEPIKDECGNSRYLNKAVDKIIEYTACSPYYLQIFCDKLVEYMNSKGIGRVTENDVDTVALLCIKEKLQDNHFHNLYAATDPDEQTKQEVKELLKVLAVGYEESNDKNGVTLEYIKEKAKDRPWRDRVDDMLSDLTLREVVSECNGKYSINVILFQLWLLQN